MKHLHKFNEHYKFEFKNNDYYKEYEFITKNNVHIFVRFYNLGFKDDNVYTREYFYVDGNIKRYGELNTDDAFAILDTVTKITVKFINDFKPERIEIDHIVGSKERNDSDYVKDYIANKVTTKRATINKRFLQRDLPKTYNYELVNSKSIITKKSSL